MGQKHGTVRAEIAGHGQYETSAKALDELIHEWWPVSLHKLYEEIKELQGDRYYDTHGLTKIEAVFIIAELTGHATN
jgi:hypothetical protein